MFLSGHNSDGNIVGTSSPPQYIRCALCATVLEDDSFHVELRIHVNVEHFQSYLPYQMRCCGRMFGDRELLNCGKWCCGAFDPTHVVEPAASAKSVVIETALHMIVRHSLLAHTSHLNQVTAFIIKSVQNYPVENIPAPRYQPESLESILASTERLNLDVEEQRAFLEHFGGMQTSPTSTAEPRVVAVKVEPKPAPSTPQTVATTTCVDHPQTSTNAVLRRSAESPRGGVPLAPLQTPSGETPSSSAVINVQQRESGGAEPVDSTSQRVLSSPVSMQTPSVSELGLKCFKCTMTLPKQDMLDHFVRSHLTFGLRYCVSHRDQVFGLKKDFDDHRKQPHDRENKAIALPVRLTEGQFDEVGGMIRWLNVDAGMDVLATLNLLFCASEQKEKLRDLLGLDAESDSD